MKGQRFLDRVAELDKLYPNDEDFPSVLASSKYPMTSLDQVKEFHEAFECKIADKPSLPPTDQQQLLLAVAAKLMLLRGILRQYSNNDQDCLRFSLEIEEQAEAMQAAAKGDLKGLLDAYLDKRYIDEGSILTFGLQDVFEEGFRRVHESNMSKLVDGKPLKDASGKVIKGPNYKPVDLTDLVDGTWLAKQKESE
jgi:predicted HAD superfamily Cof-like phosphohydrolase